MPLVVAHFIIAFMQKFIGYAYEYTFDASPAKLIQMRKNIQVNKVIKIRRYKTFFKIPIQSESSTIQFYPIYPVISS